MLAALVVELHDGVVELLEADFAALHGGVEFLRVRARAEQALRQLVELAGHGVLHAAPCLHVDLAG